MTQKIISHWHFPYPPRVSQELVFEWFEQNPDYKYYLLELPVGSGKSNIGLTVSQHFGARSRETRGDSYILTPQKILQRQYEESFRSIKDINLSSLYGKSNYTCAPKNATCDIGTLVKPRCESCPYAEARKNALSSCDTVLNYKLALTAFAFTETWKRRKLLIMDECHTLEQHLVDFDAVAISEWRCKKYNIAWTSQDTMSNALEWLRNHYFQKIVKIVSDLEEKCEPLFEMSGSDLTKADIKVLREYNIMVEHLEEINTILVLDEETLKNNFVLVHDKVMFQFKRLTGAYSFNRILLPMADKFLFMSSTILNKDGFCNDLGIDPKETTFLSLQSEFPKENRPVYYLPQMKMNVDWNQPQNESNRKTMVSTVLQLLENHKNESGIIHTANFQIAKWLIQKIEGKCSHTIIHHNPGSDIDRGTAIQSFLDQTEPSVLISPSCTEGLDLKDDLARFAMFIKVPYGFLGDQWIKRRMQMSIQWYQRRAITDIIQGGGRVVRSSTDYGTVYILDSSFQYLLSQTNRIIPQWWKDAYTQI